MQASNCASKTTTATIIAEHTCWYVRNAAAPGSCLRFLRRAQGGADVGQGSNNGDAVMQFVHPACDQNWDVLIQGLVVIINDGLLALNSCRITMLLLVRVILYSPKKHCP